MEVNVSKTKVVPFAEGSIWGPLQLKTIENAQKDFFNRILQLPPCTPGYAVRLESGVPPLAVQVLDASIR
ncbi:hypothetical protein KQX54_000098 [Cotesia glomerata]|uniref:Reverse transcriptase domain-containing protein n=1 Tax=Cotesia glomerata TaxID=32391 RepID=A0AAV7IIF1_COTGL|nr:hypothetical protein KQX54_000098 [Cotesia glomerata]